MHVHMLLKKDGRPLFYDENGYAQLSRTAMYFIGGLLKHVRSLCALTNRPPIPIAAWCPALKRRLRSATPARTAPP